MIEENRCRALEKLKQKILQMKGSPGVVQLATVKETDRSIGGKSELNRSATAGLIG